MAEHTPTTEQVRDRYVLATVNETGPWFPEYRKEPDAEFNRWLAQRDAERDERIRTEQREADAQIAESVAAAVESWPADTEWVVAQYEGVREGARQSAAAIRAVGAS